MKNQLVNVFDFALIVFLCSSDNVALHLGQVSSVKEMFNLRKFLMVK